MTDIHRLPAEREHEFWTQQQNYRAQMVNEYDEPAPDIVTRLGFRSLVAIGIAGTAIGSACLLWLIF